MTKFTCSQLKGFVKAGFVLDIKNQRKIDEISGKRDFLAKISIKAASKFSATPLSPETFPYHILMQIRQRGVLCLNHSWRSNVCVVFYAQRCCQ